MKPYSEVDDYLKQIKDELSTMSPEEKSKFKEYIWSLKIEIKILEWVLQ